MKLRIALLVLVPLWSSGAGSPLTEPRLSGGDDDTVALRVETVASGFETVWDLAWGPDGFIWLTERGGTVSRVDPISGATVRVGEIDVRERGESGLMGMTFHPDFPAEPYLFFAHSYRGATGIRNRLIRVLYESGELGERDVLINGIPGAAVHDGSRLVVGPDGYLYMTTGDASRENAAQDPSSLAGKILRLTLDGLPAPDNPFGSRVFTLGHRNPQGLAFHPETGALYSAEHGPNQDDEVNLIVSGGNYGWPDVRGSCDGGSSSEERFCRENEVHEPLHAWTPTVGASGLAVYTSDLIPGWDGSLLVTSLRSGALYRLPLTDNGRAVAVPEILFRGEFGRLRDVLVGPDGVVYMATSNRDGRGTPGPDDDRILRVLP